MSKTIKKGLSISLVCCLIITFLVFDIVPVNVNNPNTIYADTNNLIHNWRLNDGSTSTAQDLADGNYPLSLYNTTWIYDGLVCGKVLSFNGTNSYAFATNYTKPTTTATYSAWVYATSTSNNFATIIGNWGDTICGQIHLDLAGTPKHLNVDITDNSNGANVNCSDFTPFSTNQWVHVAVVADGSYIRLYKNGTQVASVTYSGTLKTSFKPLGIGVKLNDAGTGSSTVNPGYWDGEIADVRVYSRALSSTEIANMACNYQLTGALISNWTCKAYFGTETFRISNIALGQPLPLYIEMTNNNNDANYYETFPNVILDRYMEFSSNSNSNINFEKEDINNPFKLSFGNNIAVKYLTIPTNSDDFVNSYTKLKKLNSSQIRGMKPGYFSVTSPTASSIFIKTIPLDANTFQTNYKIADMSSIRTNKVIIVIPNIMAGTKGLPSSYYSLINKKSVAFPIINLNGVNQFPSNDIADYPTAYISMDVKFQLRNNIPVPQTLTSKILTYSDIPLSTLNLSSLADPNT